MPRDDRKRRHTIDTRFALLDLAGNWLYQNSSLPHLLLWYAENRIDPALDIHFDPADPETWEQLLYQMWLANIEIRRIEKPPVFTMSHRDLVGPLYERGVRGHALGDDERQRIVTDEELIGEVEPQGIVNTAEFVEL